MFKSTGFTLLEVLIALVIMAAASGIVLTHLRTLLDFNYKIRQHQQEVTQLLNETAKFTAMAYGELRTDIKPDHVDLIPFSSSEPLSRVINFSPTGKTSLPPVDQAYTPYQLYQVLPQSRYSVFLLQPGLKQPPSS
ncbi:prepilin-type N-terminal cleavage/methylation domain-containing protein [Methylomarinum vadi]|uniref:prepilin-type N-terminal cleavage/methylation domain-containing protein n=1 Tax=Methylomarinum vadi TaxID=438855 RepID=UPI0004DF66AA|nr:prepilin-type N-terminal cleavage/methylation domain-containing protein [Methylomarinum vadi]